MNVGTMIFWLLAATVSKGELQLASFRNFPFSKQNNERLMRAECSARTKYEKNRSERQTHSCIFNCGRARGDARSCFF